MSWYWWVLVYVAGYVFTVRYIIRGETKRDQRNIPSTAEKWLDSNTRMALATALVWPISIVSYLVVQFVARDPGPSKWLATIRRWALGKNR